MCSVIFRRWLTLSVSLATAVTAATAAPLPQASQDSVSQGPPAGEVPAQKVTDDKQQVPVVLEEITVTAERREEELQNVPGAVSALPQTALESFQLRVADDLASIVPNLQIKSAFSASNPTPFIRGVGLNDYNSNAVGTVGFYADNVYLSSPAMQHLQLFDLERVEVLRGPQGTLYGKNTTGGAIKLIARQPSNKREGYARIAYGRLNEVDVDGALNVPFGSGSNAVRMAFVSNNREGHTTNAFTGGRENDVGATAARVQARFVPSRELVINLRVDGAVNRAGARTYQSRGLINGADAFGYVDGGNLYQGSYNRRDIRENVNRVGTTMTVNWIRPRFALMSTTAYSSATRDVAQDIDSSPNPVVEINWGDDAKQVTQEFQLSPASRSGKVDWLAGVHLFTERLSVDNAFDFLRILRGTLGFAPDRGVFFLRQTYQQHTTSIAPFGELYVRPTARATLRFGLRDTWEKKALDLSTAFEEPTFRVPLIGFGGRDTWDAMSGEVGFDYKVGDQRLLFATLSRGFKSGGFNGAALFAPAEVTSVRPEFLTSVEFGLKSAWFNRRLHFNATTFAYDYQDLQVFNLFNTGGVPLQVLDNASDANVSGLEVETLAQVANPVRIGFNISLLDAKYKNFIRGDGTNYSGNRLINAPKWSSATWVDLTSRVRGRRLLTHIDYAYRDDVFFDPSNRPAIGMPGFGLLNARVSYEIGAGGTEVAFWGRNITDKAYFEDVFDLSDFGLRNLAMGDPRMYGAELKIGF